MAKLNFYLKNVFTKDAIEEIVKHAEIIEIKGKLLRTGERGDGGAWDQSKVISVEQHNDKAVVEFNVPQYALDDYLKMKINFKYIDGIGWKIDGNPNNLY